jgi:transposase
MPKPLTDELRAEILSYIERRSTTPWIHKVTDVSTQQINKMKRNLKKFGTVTPLESRRGPKPLLSVEMEDDLLCFLSQKPTVYLDEMKWFLYDEHAVLISVQAISDCLRRRKWSHKAV